MRKYKAALLSGIVATAIAGCGGGSGPSTTPVTLSVSDAPVDGMESVVVVFSKVALLPIGDDGADPYVFDIGPMEVNLLEYQGSDAKALIEDQEIVVGSYKMCVFANDGDHPSDPSYVLHEDDGMLPLTVKGEGVCPQGVGSEDYTGVLYFNETFTVNVNNNEFVVEFDLRRGIKEGDDNDYTIQRTSVDVINEVETGELEGDVDATNTYGLCESTSSSLDGHSHAVYLYDGTLDKSEMGPFAGTFGTAPLTAANVLLDDDEVDYEYEFGYLSPGTYSVGYTCTANDDSEDGLLGDENFVIHQAISGVVVVANQETEADF